jgi:hypothetical protein
MEQFTLAQISCPIVAGSRDGGVKVLTLWMEA